MTREVQTQVNQRQVYEPISAPQAKQVVAQPTDQLALPIQDPELLGLVKGLATLHPSLQRYTINAGQIDANRDMLAGHAARQQGKPLEPGSSGWFEHGYKMSNGQVGGDVDGQGLRQAVATSFDKDTGNIDDFIRDHFQANTKGVTDESYLQGYNESIAPHIQAIRVEQLKYQQEAVMQKVESNGMYKMGKAFQTRLDAGQPITVDDLEAARKDLNSNFGVSNTRFNDLSFNALDSLGKQGHYNVYDVLKQPKPDGTPGMYNIPEWKAKIDSAQIHSHQVFFATAKENDSRAERGISEGINRDMLGVIRTAETDMDKSHVMFESMAQAGRFPNAKEYLAAKKMYTDVGNQEATGSMLATEVDMQKGIYTGKITNMNQIADADIKPQQKRALMAELNRVQDGRKKDAAAGTASQFDTLKTPYYKEGDDYIEANLKAAQDPMDFDKSGYEYNLGQIALVKREFQDAALKVKDPKDLRAISYNLVTEAQKRAKSNKENRDAPVGAGRIRFTTISDLQTARASGQVSDEEAAVHLAYLKSQQRNTATNATR